MGKIIRLEDISVGREGWVYLIHAVGTNRYKIGRSVKPIARHQTLQNQSPYPLKIIDSFWTVDAPSDETYWHRLLKEYRVRGDWFEFNEEERKANLAAFCVGSVVNMAVIEGWFKEFLKNLLTDHAGDPIDHKFTEAHLSGFHDLISRAYGVVTERGQLEQAYPFLTSVVPERVKSSFYLYGFEEAVFEEIYYYVLGLIEAFVLLVMQKELL
jgi:hypothetical protein